LYGLVVFLLAVVKNNNISISLSAIDYWADGFDEGRFSTSWYQIVLCTGGVSQALFISLLISNLFCVKACMDVGRGNRVKANSLCPGGGRGEWVVTGTK
jgi:hypothetical protein